MTWNHNVSRRQNEAYDYELNCFYLLLLSTTLVDLTYIFHIY